MPLEITCSKEYNDIPFGHRQHNHDGHCAWLHGHNWSFHFTFATAERDENGFVIDFGKLKWLKEYLNETFDHAMLINRGDPFSYYLMGVFRDPQTWDHLEPGIRPSYNNTLAKIVIVEDASCEGIALMVYMHVNTKLQDLTHGRVFLKQVTVHEDSKNSATVRWEKSGF